MNEPYRDPESQALVFPEDPAQCEIRKLNSRIDNMKSIISMMLVVMENDVNFRQSDKLKEVRTLLNTI